MLWTSSYLDVENFQNNHLALLGVRTYDQRKHIRCSPTGFSHRVWGNPERSTVTFKHLCAVSKKETAKCGKGHPRAGSKLKQKNSQLWQFEHSVGVELYQLTKHLWPAFTERCIQVCTTSVDQNMQWPSAVVRWSLCSCHWCTFGWSFFAVCGSADLKQYHHITRPAATKNLTHTNVWMWPWIVTKLSFTTNLVGLLAIIKNTQGIYQTLRHQKAKGTETGGCNEGHSLFAIRKDIQKRKG